MNLKNNSFIKAACTVLCASIVIYQVLYNIIPLRQAIYYLKLDMISSVFAILGFLLVAWDFLTDRFLLKAKYSWVLIATIGVLCVSAVIHIEYSIVDSAKSIIWQAVQMLLLYPLATRISRDGIKKLLFVIFLVCGIAYSIAVLVSLYQFFTLTAYELTALSDNLNIRQGFYSGRLRGVFSSPYYPTLSAALLMFGSGYYFTKTKSRWLKAAYALEVFLMFVYIVLSATRSIQIALFVAAAVLGFFACRNWLESHKAEMKSALKAVICVMIAVASVAVSYLAMTATDKGFKAVAKAIASSSSFEGNNTLTTDSAEDELEELMNRHDVGSNNISNGRFRIWSDYLSVTTKSTSSALFGYSTTNYMKIIRDENPDLYIVEHIKDYYPIMYENDRIYDTHNAYLSIFVMSGVVGSLIFGAFLVLCVVKVLRHMLKRKQVPLSLLILVVMIVTILSDAFFDSDLFFRCTASSVALWLIAGVVMRLITDAEKEQMTIQATVTETNADAV